MYRDRPGRSSAYGYTNNGFSTYQPQIHRERTRSANFRNVPLPGDNQQKNVLNLNIRGSLENLSRRLDSTNDEILDIRRHLVVDRLPSREHQNGYAKDWKDTKRLDDSMYIIGHSKSVKLRDNAPNYVHRSPNDFPKNTSRYPAAIPSRVNEDVNMYQNHPAHNPSHIPRVGVYPPNHNIVMEYNDAAQKPHKMFSTKKIIVITGIVCGCLMALVITLILVFNLD